MRITRKPVTSRVRISSAIKYSRFTAAVILIHCTVKTNKKPKFQCGSLIANSKEIVYEAQGILKNFNETYVCSTNYTDTNRALFTKLIIRKAVRAPISK